MSTEGRLPQTSTRAPLALASPQRHGAGAAQQVLPELGVGEGLLVGAEEVEDRARGDQDHLPLGAAERHGQPARVEQELAGGQQVAPVALGRADQDRPSARRPGSARPCRPPRRVIAPVAGSMTRQAGHASCSAARCARCGTTTPRPVHRVEPVAGPGRPAPRAPARSAPARTGCAAGSRPRRGRPRSAGARARAPPRRTGRRAAGPAAASRRCEW